VKNALLQYSIFIKDLATGENKMKENIITALCGNMEAAQDVYNNFTRACIDAAHKILVKEVIEALDDDWKAYPGCKWGNVEKGVLYERQGEEDLKGQIYVLFNYTHLDGCEVVLYQEKEVTNLTPISISDKQAKMWNRKGWNVDREQWSEYPIWRPIRCGVLEREDPRAFEDGACWGGRFFDRMNTESEFHSGVIEEITKNIHELYKIQKILSNA
jgi:hypothetical protein